MKKRYTLLFSVLLLSFGMYATQIKEALLVEDPRETLERLYRQWWTKIEGDSQAAADVKLCTVSPAICTK